MRKSIFTSALAVAMTIVICVAFTGCGSFDPVKYVRSELEFMKTGEVTDDLLSQTEETKEERIKQYNEELDKAVEELAGVTGSDYFTKGEGKKVIEDFYKAMMAKAEFTVNDDYEEDGDNYIVTVNVTKYDIEKFMEEVSNDVIKDWTDKVTSGSVDLTDEDKLMQDMFSDVFTKMTQQLPDLKSSGKEDVKVNVVLDKDGLYTVKEADVTKLMNAMFGI